MKKVQTEGGEKYLFIKPAYFENLVFVHPSRGWDECLSAAKHMKVKSHVTS